MSNYHPTLNTIAKLRQDATKARQEWLRKKKAKDTNTVIEAEVAYNTALEKAQHAEDAHNKALAAQNSIVTQQKLDGGRHHKKHTRRHKKQRRTRHKKHSRKH